MSRSVYGCDIAIGRRDRDGYVHCGNSRAHIVAWEHENGPVPTGLVLDHMCRNRACRALHHLEPVTQSENERRKSFAYLSRRKLCPKGHQLNLANRIVVQPYGGIVCRQCNKEAAG